VLLLLATAFAGYIVAGMLAGPDWGAAAHGLVVPSMPLDRQAILTITAVVGTTLAPWGLSFIQSYAVDKRLTPADLRYERIDVITGAVMTGVIGAFVVVACAATLHASGRSITDASDAAAALEPLAGNLAGALFGAGLLGAALLAASVLPLSTAYSVSEALGREGALDDPFAEARVFYCTYGAIVGASALMVLVPGAPLVSILFLTQALNAVLLLPLLVFLARLSRDPALMGEHRSSRAGAAAQTLTIAVLAVCVAALAILSLAP
jgi:Mn2+/Fe2+ NRAMP family transporter